MAVELHYTTGYTNGGYAETQVSVHRRKRTSRRMDLCSVLLQVPTQDKDSFSVVCNGKLLDEMNVSCSDSVKVLKVPALCENDINLETITDLIRERGGEVSEVVGARQ